ncbi:Hypothetical predicted protein [Marmota monax]|uniref:Transmembrane protein 100 n=1 Tax=Marmota monax TaxID=9995 RepID=A0A5E4C221_MARMO|nr:Hypothetical predicted protein [Marmota monax]
MAGRDRSHPPRSAGTTHRCDHSVGDMSAPEPDPTPLGLAHPEMPGALRALLLATGGAGVSWPRCVLPFGAVAVLAGAAATTITFSLRGPRLDLAQGASLAALGVGLGLLIATFLCWHARRRQRAGHREREGAVDALSPPTPHQGQNEPVVSSLQVAETPSPDPVFLDP